MQQHFQNFLAFPFEDRFLISFVVLFVLTIIIGKIGDWFVLPPKEYQHNWKRSRYGTIEERRA